MSSIFKYKLSIITLISFSCLIQSCNNQSGNPEGKEQKKIIHISEEWVEPPPDFDTLKLSVITENNSLGKPIEKLQHSKFDGSVIIRTTWTYDEHGYMTSMIIDNYEVNQVYEEKFVNEYDEKGRRIRALEKNSNTPGVLEHTYGYFDDGSYTDTIKLQSEVMSITAYTKDEKVIWGKNFQQQSEMNTEFDEHGNYTKRQTTFADGPSTLLTYDNHYDSLGNLVHAILDHRSREYEYNENGDVIREFWLENGQPYLKKYFKYKYFE